MDVLMTLSTLLNFSGLLTVTMVTYQVWNSGSGSAGNHFAGLFARYSRGPPI